MNDFEQAIYADLISLAASIASRDNMPPVFVDDWNFCETIPKRDIRRVLKRAVMADEQCGDWAYRLRQIANRISKEKKKCPRKEGK